MANSDFTKFMIARDFKQLLETNSFLNISVGDIASTVKSAGTPFTITSGISTM